MATFGRFTLEEKLATGGMAEVWLAHVTGQNEQRVLKRVLPHLAENQGFNEMLLTEARVVMGLQHPNIVRVYEVGAVEGVTFISMEYVPGSDLGLLMRRATVNNQKVPTPIALRIARSLCEALAAVHSATNERGAPLNLVHRDVSPQNVMISVLGETKLLDFGIVKAFNELALTEPGTIKGKFAYMSPEQAAGRPLDGRSDLYAAGLVTYELLSGVRAHRRETEPATYQAALTGDVPPLSKVWPKVPAELEAIVAKALSVDPDERFQTGQELASALELCAEAAEEAEVARWSTSLIAARVPGATPLPAFSFDTTENLLTVETRAPADNRPPSIPIARLELTAKPLELPVETPLSLPDEPVALMPLANASSAVEAFDEPVEERAPAASVEVRLSTPRSPAFWAGLVAIAVGALGLVASLRDPLDGLGQWAAPVACLGLTLFGALAAFNLFDRREALVALPIGGVLLGLARGDLVMVLASGGLAAAMWWGSDDDDDHELRSRLSLLGALPALVLCVIAALGAWMEHAPAADSVAWARRQGTTEVTSRVSVADVMTFEAPGWRLRPSLDAPGATELTKPDIRATLVARVLTVTDMPPFEALLAQATADFARRGWGDFIMADHHELTDEADESHLVTFRVRRGLVWSTGTMRIARVDETLCTLVMLVADRRVVAFREEALRIGGTLRCSPGGTGVTLSPETLNTVRKGLVTLRAQDRVELGVVIGVREKQLIILADDSFLGEATPPALPFRPLLAPGDPLRRAVVLRRKPGAVLLLAEADTADLAPLNLKSPEGVEAKIVTLGLADEALTSRLQVRPGVLARRLVTFDPHVRNRSGPILTSDGTLVGLLRAGEGATRGITMASDVEPLLSPGIRTMSWKLNIDDTHQCTVAVRAELDDPFKELQDFAVLFGAPHQEEEVRKEQMVGRTNASLLAHVPCPLEKTVSVGLRVTGNEQSSKMTDTVQMATEFPAAMRGQRTDLTRPGVADLTLLSWLFDPGEARKSACAIEECDKACTAGNGEACLVLGQSLYNAGRPNLAINDYERGCVKHSYESCIQLTYLATPKTIDTFTAVLKPWCEVGIKRACVALEAAQWREQLKKETAECAKSREACDREADLLLEGPRRPAEVTRARTVLDRRCRDGAPAVCLRAGFEWQRAGKLPEAADAFERACKGGVAAGCVERAGLMAIGVNGPRNVEAAARALRATCDAGDARACAAIARVKP